MNIAHNLQKDFKRSLDFAMHFISKTNYMIMNKSNMFRMNVRGIEYNP